MVSALYAEFFGDAGSNSVHRNGKDVDITHRWDPETQEGCRNPGLCSWQAEVTFEIGSS